MILSDHIHQQHNISKAYMSPSGRVEFHCCFARMKQSIDFNGSLCGRICCWQISWLFSLENMIYLSLSLSRSSQFPLSFAVWIFASRRRMVPESKLSSLNIFKASCKLLTKSGTQHIPECRRRQNLSCRNTKMKSLLGCSVKEA